MPHDHSSQLATDFGTSFVAIVIPMQDPPPSMLAVGFTREPGLVCRPVDYPARAATHT
jgi:hypothetical protein